MTPDEFEALEPKIRRRLERLGRRDPSLADDIIQDVLLAMWLLREQIEAKPESRVLGYAVTAYKRRKITGGIRQTRYREILGELTYQEVDEYREPLEPDDIEMLTKCIERLATPERDFVKHVYMLGMTQRAYAQSRGLSDVRIHRMKKKVLVALLACMLGWSGK